MKRNKTRLVGEINEFKRKIDTLKNKALVQKSTEKILENGLTNNSRIKVKAVNINIDYFSNQNEKNISLNNVNVSSAKLKFTFGNYTQEIDSSTLNRKIAFDLTDMSQLDNPLRIYLINRNQEIFVDKISVREILEVSCERKYCFENVAFDLNLVWVNSKVNFYNKEIARIEAMLSENKESVDVLINSIGHIEETFKKYFQEANKNLIENPNPLYNEGTMKKELEYSQKIEDQVLKMVGKEVVKWDTMVFLFYKIILGVLILVFLRRFDLITFLICTILAGLEYGIVSTKHSYKALFGLIGSIFFDIVWILYYLSTWSVFIQIEGTSTGTSIRQVCIVSSIIVLLMKFVLAFSLWRLSLEYKLLRINRKIIKQQRTDGYKTENESRSSKIVRPNLKYSINANTQIPLRNLDDE